MTSNREKLQVIPPIELHSTVCDFEIIKKEIGGEASKSTYIHEQPNPSNVWEINHNLDAFPTVTIVDSLNRLILCEFVYIDRNNIQVLFNALVAGKAYLN